MSREHLVRTVANTIATVALRFNMTGKQPSDLYHAMAEHLADAQLLQSPETAAEMEAEPLALPWAHVMPDDDLHGFLGDLLSAAIGRWQHSPEVPDRDVLAAVEKACAAWRTPGQGYRSDEPAEPERPADEDPIRYTLTEQVEDESYPGELAMLRGLVATLRVVAEHGDLTDVVKLLDEHQRDEQDAYAEADK